MRATVISLLGFKVEPERTERVRVRRSRRCCVGDVKSLQKAAYDLSLGLDYMVSPTWQLPFSMKQHNSNMAPGSKVYSQESGKDNGAKQISNVKLDYMPLTEYVRTLQQRIKDGGYYDLLMLQQLQEKAGATATEANIWSNKEPFLFGPVQQKIEIDDLVPSIDIVTQFADEAGLFDHISGELRGRCWILNLSAR